jgi:hypothetical protein
MMDARVSNIEAFRRWRDWKPWGDNDEEPTIDDLVRHITLDEPSEAMKAGKALHKALEHSAPGEFDTLSADGYTFHLAGGEIVLPEIREVRSARNYGSLMVTGKADCVRGLTVTDHKTTARFDAESYLAGCQWKFYLELFGADVFQWNVFEIKETDPKVYRVGEPQILKAYRYPEIGRDCADLAAEYLQFARTYLPADFDPLAREAAEE